MTLADTPHPGFIVRQRCFVSHWFGVVDGARLLGISRQALSNIATARPGISSEMAVRLAKAFGVSDEHRLQLQLACDLAQVRKRAHTHNVTAAATFTRDRIAPQPKLL